MLNCDYSDKYYIKITKAMISLTQMFVKIGRKEIDSGHWPDCYSAVRAPSEYMYTNY